MVRVFVAYTFDAEVINYQCEGGGPPHVLLESWRVLAWVETCFARSLDEQVVGELACGR